jgi:hypothetical protein
VLHGSRDLEERMPNMFISFFICLFIHAFLDTVIQTNKSFHLSRTRYNRRAGEGAKMRERGNILTGDYY